jgi:hypothetical protein
MGKLPFFRVYDCCVNVPFGIQTSHRLQGRIRGMRTFICVGARDIARQTEMFNPDIHGLSIASQIWCFCLHRRQSETNIKKKFSA